MRRLILRASLVSTLAILGAALPVSSGASAATRSCRESDRFIQRVRAENLRCRTAVAVALRHARTASCFAREGGFIYERASRCSVRVAGRSFRCRPSRQGVGIAVRCTRRDNVVRFHNSGG